MRTLRFNNLQFITFRQWINESFAIYNTVKKLVLIATLPAVYTLLLSLPSQAQTDTIRLEEIKVEASKIPINYMESASTINIIDKSEIAQMPVLDIHDLLNFALSVDLRQRGSNGVQSDVSIRGGSFEQTLVLLNGVKLNDPQTGHHNLNLPVDLESVERIEILKGPGSRIFGSSAFTGVINIVTNKSKEKFIKANLGAGQFGYRMGNFSSAYDFNSITNYFSYSYKESDGYTNNTDFLNSSLFYQVSSQNKFFNFYGQAGYSNKLFGANSFYTPLFPDQFEKTKTFFASAKFEKEINNLTIIPSLNWRRHQDHFRLERNNPDFYTNNHITNVYGAEINFVYKSKLGISVIGSEFREESILSNALGEPMNDSISVPGETGFYFTHEKSRNNLNVFVQQNINFKQTDIDLGFIGYYISDYDWKFFPGINVSQKITDNLVAFSGYNYSFRIPSFTELYYLSPTNRGNLNLKPEKSSTFDLGIKYIHPVYFTQLSVFYRNGQDLIDWALDTSDVWVSRNVNEINAYGFEYELKLYLEKSQHNIPLLHSLYFNYSYLDMDKSSGAYTSFYILDYLKHKMNVTLNFKIIEKIGFSFLFNYQDRYGTYTDFPSGEEVSYAPFNTFDLNLYWKNNRFKVYFYVNNIFDTEYADLANITMPGRWIKLGLKYNLPL